MKLFFFILNLLIAAHGSIFYDDDRTDFYNIKNNRIKEISSSIPALIQKSKLQKVKNGYKIKAENLKSSLNFCSDARFSQEYQLANCSASLIAPDLVLTAAHCLNQNPENIFHPNKYLIAFDYKKTKQNSVISFFPKQNVYEIEDHMPLFLLNWNTTLDLAVLKLKRKVTDRKALKLNLNHNYIKTTPLFILGYPLGISQKLTADSNIISTYVRPDSFRHHLDTFSVNSGSAIFDANTYEIIGVHVRGTGSNYKKYGKDCNDWFLGNPSKDYGEGNMLNPFKNELSKLLNLTSHTSN